jgi:hypothetical protein
VSDRHAVSEALLAMESMIGRLHIPIRCAWSHAHIACSADLASYTTERIFASS